MSDQEDDALSSAFVDRLRAAMGDMPQAVVAKRARISSSAMSKIMQGAEPGLFKARRIAAAVNTSLDYLVTGKGAPDREGGHVEIPVLDVRLAAGAASLADGAQQIGTAPIDYELLRVLGRSSAEGLRYVEAEGDSMEPLISDGARVLVDTRDSRLREGIFAFRLGDELRIKRLRRLGVDGVSVISENPRYDPEVLQGHDLEHFAILGRALGGFNVY